MAKNQKPNRTAPGKDIPWKKYAVAAVCLFFAVAMVLSYMPALFNPSGYHQASRESVIGDNAVIGYTFYDDHGRPVLTTSQVLFNQGIANGSVVLLTQPIEIPVGSKISEDNIATVPIYPQLEGYSGFAVLGFELDAISEGLIGVSAGDLVRIPFYYGGNLLQMNLTAEEFNGIGGNFSLMNTGDQIPVGLTKDPTIPLEDAEQTPEVPLRTAEIIEKGDDSLILRYGYAGAEVFLMELA